MSGSTHPNQSTASNIQIPDLITATLISSGAGVEMIHHRLDRLALWTIELSDDSNHFETIYMLSGRIKCMENERVTYLSKGDSRTFHPVAVRVIFQAEVESEFIYVSSKPVYKTYAGVLNQIRKLAVNIEKRNGYTADHCARIMKLSLQVGVSLGLCPGDLYHLQFAALFHDVGKIRVPLEYLTKAGALTSTEWLEMKLHPSYGREILMKTEEMDLSIPAAIVEQHHERYDGSGYPFGLCGDEINICAAIIGIADSYDAMTSVRNYQTTKSHQVAIHEIGSLSGKLYHPHVVEHFLSIF